MTVTIGRRELLAALGGAAAAWPLAARAQQARVPTIGWLGGATPAAQSQWAIAFTQRLRMLGWSEGSTVVIEYRWAEGRPERFAEIAAEFVRLKVDVILAAGTEAALAAKQATAIIPIVFPVAGDPVGTGLVASLARPDANVTGVSNQSRDLAAKRLELLREVVRGLRHSAILLNAGYPAGVLEMGEVHSAARSRLIRHTSATAQPASGSPRPAMPHFTCLAPVSPYRSPKRSRFFAESPEGHRDFQVLLPPRFGAELGLEPSRGPCLRPSRYAYAKRPTPKA